MVQSLLLYQSSGALQLQKHLPVLSGILTEGNIYARSRLAAILGMSCQTWDGYSPYGLMKVRLNAHFKETRRGVSHISESRTQIGIECLSNTQQKALPAQPGDIKEAIPALCFRACHLSAPSLSQAIISSTPSSAQQS
jgi:hypothetical protein